MRGYEATWPDEVVKNSKISSMFIPVVGEKLITTGLSQPPIRHGL